MKLTTVQKIARRAAQDILNMTAQAFMESGQLSLPRHFVKRMTVNNVAALIETRMMEGTIGSKGLPPALVEGRVQL